MAKKESQSFSSVLADIKARRFAPVYILMGEEGYFIDRLCEALATTILPLEEREFNQFTLYGLDVAPGQLYNMAREFPMMAEYKVIIVKEAQNIKNTDELEKYLEHPSPQTILIFCHKNGNISARSKFLAKAKAVGVVFESKKVAERELPAFVTAFVTSRGKTISPQSATIIAESIGSDLCRMATELDKLCLAIPLGEKQEITPLLVEQCIGLSREYNAYEFRKAVIEKNALRANRILNYFDHNPKSGGIFILLPTLFNYFQNLMIAWYAPNKQSRGELASFLDLKSEWAAQDYILGMKNYSALKTMQIIAAIRQTDEKVKGLNVVNTDNSDLAKELLFFILH